MRSFPAAMGRSGQQYVTDETVHSVGGRPLARWDVARPDWSDCANAGRTHSQFRYSLPRRLVTGNTRLILGRGRLRKKSVNLHAIEGVDMDLSTTFRHLEPSDALREYGHQKVSRLQKFLRQPMTARITLSVEKHDHQVEVQLTSGGQHFEAKEASGDMYASIDAATHKLERQIHDAKGLEGSKRRRETDIRHVAADSEVAVASGDS